jgi:hypothetical protein
MKKFNVTRYNHCELGNIVNIDFDYGNFHFMMDVSENGNFRYMVMGVFGPAYANMNYPFCKRAFTYAWKRFINKNY